MNKQISTMEPLIVAIGVLMMAILGPPLCSAQPALSARLVKCKQGSVKGVLVVPANRELQPVEAFLGIPYASPPVGALRFMPPVSPLPWNGVRTMDKYGPACPQTLADISNEREALRFVTRGRLQYLRRLLPYLRNQSEDCLYLNIYAPVTVGVKDVDIKFPVIVFIHGESYEWNSGNPYDGSILSSYGDVVVVTFNFRLGILGFLRPDLRENKAANFGLLDQIAALQWIKENIAEFGGNPDLVTLLGHGTGAACVNFLLTSPVAQASNGLFHRAIVMSGTALADWSVTGNPLRYTLQAAQQMNCPLVEQDDELATCLRFKKVTELMNIRLQAPLYASPLAPVVDGIVVPNEPRQSMKTYKELFGRYDVLYGVTHSESFHLLNAATLQFGITETERNRIIRTYVRNNYAHNIDQVTAAILNAYTDWRSPARDTEDYRDSVLEILSDARVVAPVLQMGNMHSAVRQKSYFYVFAHQTSSGDYPQSWGSIHGEELPYVFGMPLVGGTNHLALNYTRAEMLLSEMIITYWTNFARTGNPNFPPRQKFLSITPYDRFETTNIQWPTFDRHSQKYLNIELRPKVKDHYRADKMALWSKLIPELVSNTIGSSGATKDGDEDELTATPTGGFRPTLPLAFSNASPSWSWAKSDFASGSTAEPSNPAMDAQPTQGRGPSATHFPIHVSTVRNGSWSNPNNVLTRDDVDGASGMTSGSVALSIVVVVGLCFLVLNICACAGVFYQRDRVRFKERLMQRQYRLRPATQGAQSKISRDFNKPAHKTTNQRNQNHDLQDLELLTSMLPSQASINMMDPHTKVSQWMAQEVVPASTESDLTPPSARKLIRPNLSIVLDEGSGICDPRDVLCLSSDPSSLLKKTGCRNDTHYLVPPFSSSLGTHQTQPLKDDLSNSIDNTGSDKVIPGVLASHLDSNERTKLSDQLPLADLAETGDGANRRWSTIGRRRGRPKSQLNFHRSISKRDVAVGNDELSFPSASSVDQQRSPSPSNAINKDSFRRLNLPKVLPDFPQATEATMEDGCSLPASTSTQLLYITSLQNQKH